MNLRNVIEMIRGGESGPVAWDAIVSLPAGDGVVASQYARESGLESPFHQSLLSDDSILATFAAQASRLEKATSKHRFEHIETKHLFNMLAAIRRAIAEVNALPAEMAAAVEISARLVSAASGTVTEVRYTKAKGVHLVRGAVAFGLRNGHVGWVSITIPSGRADIRRALGAQERRYKHLWNI
jgi:hypothetical protein